MSADSLRGAGLVRRLGAGTFNYGLGQALPQVVRFLLLPVFTLFLTPTDYGILDLAAALSGVLVLTMRLGVPGSVTRFYFDYREGADLRDYVTTVAWFLIGGSLAVGALCLVALPAVLAWTVPGLPYAPYVVLVVIGAVLSANYDLQLRLVQAREQARFAARLNIGRAAIAITLALVFVAALRWGAAGMLLSEVVASGLFLVQAIVYLRPDLRGTFRWGMLRSSLVYAIGILPSHLLGSLVPLATRSLLSGADSLAAVGLFGIGLRFARPLDVVNTAFNRAYTPVYFSLRASGKPSDLDRLAAAARNVWGGAVGLTAGIALLGPPAILLLTPERFHAAAPLVPVLALGMLAQTVYTLFGSEIFYGKKTYLVPVVSLCGAAATVGITILTARRFGATGVAWATTAGLIATALAAGLLSRRLVRLPVRPASFLRIAAAGAAVYALGRLLPADTWTGAGARLGCLAVFPALLWLSGDPTVREAAAFLRNSRREEEEDE